MGVSRDRKKEEVRRRRRRRNEPYLNLEMVTHLWHENKTKNLINMIFNLLINEMNSAGMNTNSKHIMTKLKSNLSIYIDTVSVYVRVWLL